MAVPTYDELLAHFDMKKSVMKLTFDDKHLKQFSLILDTWEKLAWFLEMPSPDIASIKSQGYMEEQKIRMLECWKQRCGSMATYETMVKALLKISRTDLAEKVITLRQSSRDVPTGLPSLQSPTTSISNTETPSSKIKCGKPNLPDAFRQLLPVSKEWKNIGVLLTFSSNNLDRLERDEPDTNSRLRAMLSEWLKQVNPPPTWTQLVSAVEPFNPSKAKELQNCFKDLPE